ncbi:GNAT family N-acetyltransferase [Shewanella surugensis]|uniref:GNAT family N-acetyltransferase n=1 Tax=Shewanella surugensis TaxID=212020 RepID=A0ABT0LCC5_9GAMM|nr:GNAT family N-acetyltransferase [Shewanella surugensis]MCL1125359.1 GNAT family N-acetyltransferase [Shewanella surugensis]
MELHLLADKAEYIPKIAKWYSDEWGDIGESRSTKALELKLTDYLNRNKLPMIVLAMEKDKLLGAAQLKFHEMSIYPDKEHWLGGVYIDKPYRGQGIAKQLIDKVIALAKHYQVSHLYLQTEDHSGGLYAQSGWQSIERVNYKNVDVLVMKKVL